MESFKTQFMMSGVRTYVTVEELENNTFGCILNLVEFFEGNEIPVRSHDFDLVLKSNDKEGWVKEGTSKVNLNREDLQNLGEAITMSLQ